MKHRTWRAGALAAGIAVVVHVATQTAAGQPSAQSVTQPNRPALSSALGLSSVPAIPEADGLVLLGAAFVVVAHQLRRLG